MTVRAASQIGMAKITDTARKLGVGDYPNYLSIALGAGDTTVARLVNAYAILANQGRSVSPTTIDYVENREGRVIYRADNRCAIMQGCNAPDWNGKPMPRPPLRSKQLVDAMAAFQMVHVMEGVITRGTAVILRDLNRPLFGKTGTTNGPTNVWFVGGTPDIVAGVYVGYDQPRPLGRVQGASVAAPIWKDWAKIALKDQPKTPFVAPPGIRWVRIDRASGKRVYGVFPTTEEPQSPIIWEAFQPQTEPRRSFRRRNEATDEQALTAAAQQAPSRQPAQPQYQMPAPVEPFQPPQAAPLQNTAAAH
jgi:penicillin-binding protein 1A